MIKRDVTLAEVLERLLLFARALGFVFLVYLVPVVLRDVVAVGVLGEHFEHVFTGTSETPLLLAALGIVTLAASAGFVLLHARTGRGAGVPLPLLRWDRPWRSEWWRGIALGLGLASAAILPLVLAGRIRIEGLAATPFERPELLLATVLLFVVEGVREELGFRGPAQRDLTRSLGFPIAAFFLAGSFTIIHSANPDFDRRALLGILLAGLALAGLARARGDLGMVCGCHVGWNVAVSLLWSTPVSGFDVAAGLLEVEVLEGAWTGGTFGIEGGWAGILVLAIFGFFTWRLPAKEAVPAQEITGPTEGR